MDKSNPVSTPLPENIKLSKGTIEEQIENPRYYQSIVGSIMYTREKLLEGEFFLFHVTSAENSADLITKSLERQLYDKHTKLLACNREEEC